MSEVHQIRCDGCEYSMPWVNKENIPRQWLRVPVLVGADYYDEKMRPLRTLDFCPKCVPRLTISVDHNNIVSNIKISEKGIRQFPWM